MNATKQQNPSMLTSSSATSINR